MEVFTEYAVYRTKSITENSNEVSLVSVKFKGMTANRFVTEEDAIEALKNDGKTFEDFLILKRVMIHNFE